ncbi:MAG: hypothetical protein IKN15_13375 [Bacteroidaceae bacterium]|nr:hypothetical protein [Bacteroidaceae bacterium]
MAQMTNTTPVADAIKEYLHRGFGSMTKNDFEVWIFHQLINGELKGRTNREISIALRIPDTKVKRLRYEADLKWGSPDNDSAYHEALVTVINKARFVREKKQILLVIEDTALLKYLDAKMKNANVAWDKSFNTENIYIDFEQYETFCKEVLTEEYNDTIKFLNENNFKDANPIVKFFKELGNKTREEVIKELADGAVSAAKFTLPLLLSLI